MLCNNKQLHLEYCSCLSTWLERLSTHLDMLVNHSSCVLILSSFSFRSSSYSSNLLEIKSIASVSSAKCFSPLICPSFSSFVFSKICVICLSTFLIQLNKMLTQSGDFKLSVNTSSGYHWLCQYSGFHHSISCYFSLGSSYHLGFASLNFDQNT